ncbi:MULTISPECIES: GAF domain-containing protein [Mesorhizobium]|uniref:GAF domain-containing protein n=1 Tax=Mesorhizobium abyssinicae TaxID=1209958 RepID=A0ABU5AS96_9HYPH|nr:MULTISPECIES: GAF domain-containing protein [Mesorhizobium]MDX8540165.1 GAF domain-containing protein [Mesorhizobium abyssinicae]RVD20552.1 GAF domain-containing protein [Mesorhizobium sp. M4B.F.Ca.ET.017.02.2.1]RWX69530.1 GAF domain-containing protein [Mesorhizobium sp. M4B.F.Ca.ET.089.01.1.1]
MFAAKAIESTDKPAFYNDLAAQLKALLEGERDSIANAANTAALIYQMVPDLNWAGFYFLQSDEELVLGPFQGKPACVRIAVGKGVCGTAVDLGMSMLVKDVHEFEGHIACDADSRSELVVLLRDNDGIFGVFDLDSPLPGRFDKEDQAGIEKLAAIYVAASAFEPD